METLEKQVSDAILQNASETLTIDGRVFAITPPTPATLIMISAFISEIPVAVNRETKNVLNEVLSTAKDLSIIGKVIATLILGAKRIKEKRTIVRQRTEYYEHWSWRKLRRVTEEMVVGEEVLELDWLAEKLLDEVTTQTLLKVTARRIGLMQIADFFELTASLSEANLTRRTKEAETAFGA